MALLSDRDAFDRLTCRRLYFADAIAKLIARVPNAAVGDAMHRYARWRAFDDDHPLDDCFHGVSADQRHAIIDAVDGLWAEAKP